jgi:hypothetical protein
MIEISSRPAWAEIAAIANPAQIASEPTIPATSGAMSSAAVSRNRSVSAGTAGYGWTEVLGTHLEARIGGPWRSNCRSAKFRWMPDWQAVEIFRLDGGEFPGYPVTQLAMPDDAPLLSGCQEEGVIGGLVRKPALRGLFNERNRTAIAGAVFVRPGHRQRPGDIVQAQHWEFVVARRTKRHRYERAHRSCAG